MFLSSFAKTPGRMSLTTSCSLRVPPHSFMPGTNARSTTSPTRYCCASSPIPKPTASTGVQPAYSISLRCLPELIVLISAIRRPTYPKQGLGLASPKGSILSSSCTLSSVRSLFSTNASILSRGIRSSSTMTLSAYSFIRFLNSSILLPCMVRPAAISCPPYLSSRSSHAVSARNRSNFSMLLAEAFPVPSSSNEIMMVGL